MKLDMTGVARDVWTTLKRDRAVLTPIAGLFAFVPLLAHRLLVPEMPVADATMPPEASATAFIEALQLWMQHYAALHLASIALPFFAGLAIVACYANPRGEAVGAAMLRALARLLRVFLAVLLVMLPFTPFVLATMVAPLFLAVLIVPLLYVQARTMLIAPLVLATDGLGAVAAIGRSWRLTRGNGLVLTALLAVITLSGQFAAGIADGADHAMKAAGIANPVVMVLINALAAAILATAQATVALVEVAVYRRLVSNSGT